MKCDKVKELLPFLDEGSHEPETAGEVRKHLKECPVCQREYNEMKNVIHIVRRTMLADEPEPVQGYLGIVRRKIERKKKARTFYFRAVSAAAVVVFAVSISMFGYMNLKTTEPVSENSFVTEDLGEFDEYIATADLNGYDLNQLVDTDEEEQQVIVNTLLAGDLLHITTEDIMELMDEDELNMVFASYER